MRSYNPANYKILYGCVQHMCFCEEEELMRRGFTKEALPESENTDPEKS